MMYAARPPHPSPAAREREVSANTPSPAQRVGEGVQP
jgi:hypothetical protein